MDLINVTSTKLRYRKISKDYIPQKKRFLWFFPNGAVHRSLDILLEIFSANNDIYLDIVGSIDNEKDFFNAYRKELTEMPNIKYYGYQKTDSRSFKKIMKEVFCFIAPSCSEGMSSSVATCLTIGLYPILSRSTGITLPSDTGIYIDSNSKTDIKRAIYEAYNLNNEDIAKQITICQKFALEQFSRDRFIKNMTQFISKALNKNNMTKKVDFSKYEKAVLRAQDDKSLKDVIKNAYIKRDFMESSLDFEKSKEFNWCVKLLKKNIHNNLEGKALLDCGGGTGITAHALSGQGLKVTMLDIDKSEICGTGIAKKIREKSKRNFDIVESDITKMPFHDNYFDIVFCRQVLHHATDLESLGNMVKEMARVLKPGGFFLALREHVIKNMDQLKIFRRNHPFYKYGTFENAFLINEYVDSIKKQGNIDIRVLSLMQDLDDYKENCYSFSPKMKSIKPFLDIPLVSDCIYYMLWKRYLNNKLKNLVPGEEFTLLGWKK